MPESQQHGCIWEDAIKRDVYGITQRIPYTSKFDIPKEFNCHNPQTNVSIKTSQMKSVDMGDVLRVFENTETTQLLVIRYRQEGDTKKLREIILCNMPSRETFFGSVELSEIQNLTTMIKSVPKGKPDEVQLKTIHDYKDQLNAKSGCLRFRPKLDSKNQRRLQCSIADFDGFLTSNPQLILERNSQGILFKKTIPLQLDSCRRVRNSSAHHSEPE